MNLATAQATRDTIIAELDAAGFPNLADVTIHQIGGVNPPRFTIHVESDHALLIFANPAAWQAMTKRYQTLFLTEREP